MNIDIQPIRDFEQGFSDLLDLLDQLKRLAPPKEADGAIGIARWHRDFQQIFRTFSVGRAPNLLERFAEDLERALAVASNKASAAQETVESFPTSESQGMLETPHGFWARLTSEKAGGGGYYSWTKLKEDGVTLVDPAVTGTDDAKEVNAAEGLPVGAAGTGAVVWLERDDTDDPAEWRFASPGSTNEVEGGTVPSAVIPAADQGWIYKYTRAGVVEDAHADPRNETVYIPENAGTNCGVWPALDARGHTLGWWFLEAGAWVNWYSPWGFPDPGAPP